MKPADWHRRFSEQAAWTTSAREYLFSQTKLPTDASILEVGCGTGAILGSLASAFSRPAHGVDINFDYLHLAGENMPTARLVCGDAHRLPYPQSSFDACMCHFFLMWVDAPTALKEMRRVTRPGGWILALAEPDYGGRIDYPEALRRIGELQRQALRDQGGEPEMGRRLSSLFHQTGLSEIRTGVIGGEWTAKRSLESLKDEWQVTMDDLNDLATKKELRDCYLIDRAAHADGSRTLFVPVFFAVGRAPEAYPHLRRC